MDPKLAAILKKAKAIDTATTQKFGNKGSGMNHSGGLMDQIGDSSQLITMEEAHNQGMMPASTSAVSGVDRINVDSEIYNDSVKSSNLPPSVKKAMMETPIPQPDSVDPVDSSFIEEINPERNAIPDLPDVSYNESDERDFDHPITPQSRRLSESYKKQNTSSEGVSKSMIRKMIAEEIGRVLPTVIDDYFDKRVINEQIQVKVGNTIFSGNLSPMPQKRKKRK